MARAKSKTATQNATQEPLVTADTVLGNTVTEVEVVEAAVQNATQEQGTDTQTQEAAQPVVQEQKKRKLREGTNAARVRTWIAEAKQDTSKTEAEQKAAVVDKAVAELGQKRGLARVYVKENWSRV